jgi:hypothetical protein
MVLFRTLVSMSLNLPSPSSVSVQGLSAVGILPVRIRMVVAV